MGVLLVFVAGLSLMYVVQAVSGTPNISDFRNTQVSQRTQSMGNLRDLVAKDDSVARQLAQEYGGVVRLHGILGLSSYDLLISDPVALHHLFLSPTGGWDLSDHLLSAFKSIFGPGVAAVQGADHARQRRVISRALNPLENAHILPAVQLVSQKLVSKLGEITSPDVYIHVDAYHWMRRTAVEALTRFAFGVDLASLDHDTNCKRPLEVFEGMLVDCFGTCSDWLFWLRETTAGGLFPKPMSVVASLLLDYRAMKTCFNVMSVVKSFSGWVSKEREQHRLQQDGADDFLSVLQRASSGASKYFLHPDEVSAQIGMVLFAGYDSVSIASSLLLYDLAHKPQCQSRVRAEIEAKVEEMEGRPFAWDDYESMTYLTAVIRESMRLHPGMGSTTRQSRRDDVLPLSSPIKTIDGRVLSSLAVDKGTTVIIDIASLHRRADLWGDQPEEFRPERWLHSKEGGRALPLSKSPGIWTLLSFLSGPRTCLGYRIAVLELHVLMTDVIYNFEILPAPGVVVEREDHHINVPKVKGVKSRGGNVPIRLRRIARD